MNNIYQPDETPTAETWSPQELSIRPPKKSLGARIMGWWHSIATPPEPPQNATVLQREKHRRARSVSTIVFFFAPAILVGLSTTLSMPNPSIFWVACSVLVALLIAPFFNRAGQVFIAAMFIVLSLQFTIAYIILTTTPRTEVVLQLYDIFSLVILLALAILPLRAIWVITILDCVFIATDLLYQERTRTFTALLNHEGLVAMLVRPLIILLFLTGVCSFLLTSVTRAVRQSYEAEFVANIEHAAAQQNEIEAEAKRELEDSIQQIVQAHTNTMNGKTRESIPYPTAKVLWPLVGILNSLWTRLQRSQQREQELAQLQADIMKYDEIVQHAIRSPEQPLTPYQTRTTLAPLTLSVANLHRELLSRMMSLAKRTRGGQF